MWSIIEIAADIIECVLISRFIILYFGYRDSRLTILKSLALLSLTAANDIIGDVFSVEPYIVTAVCITVCIGFSVLFLEGSILEKILVSILNIVVMYIINLCVLTSLSYLTDNSAQDILTLQNIGRITGLILTKLLYFVVTQLIISIKNKNKYLFTKSEWIIIIATFISTLSIELMFFSTIMGNKNTELIFFIITLLFAALNIIVFIFMKKISVGNRQRMENDLLTLQLEQEKKQIELLHEKYEEIAKLRHDIKNYAVCAQSLIREKDYSQAEEYLSNLIQNKIESSKSFIHSSSSVINAIVNDKFSTAENAGITVDCIIYSNIPKGLEFDLSIMLANMLDNAIEGASSIDGKAPLIDMKISEKSGYIKITLKNSISRSVLKNNPKLHTSKKDSSRHGIGLRSIREIAESHGGFVDVYEENDMFVVNVLLKSS